MNYTSILAVQNYAKNDVKHVEMDGVKYVSVPMVMILEGVHNGNNGPIFYPEAELKKTPSMWNMKPIVVRHPDEGDTATTPEVVEKQGVGIVMNTRWENGKLKAEAWINKDKADKVDQRVLNAVINGNPMEVSTGMYAECAAGEGKWKDEAYIGTACGIRADHLAILPDCKGACSLADGAGLLMNEDVSFEDVRRKLQPLVPKDSYIEATYTDFIVYTTFEDGRFFKVGYRLDKDGKASLEGVPEEVTIKTQWETLSGTFVANAENITLQRKDKPMKKEEMIAKLIANAETPWEEKDRETLNAMPDEVLEKVFGTKPETPVQNAEKPAEGKEAKDKDKEKDKDKDKPVQNAEAPAQPAVPPITDEAIYTAIQNGNSSLAHVLRDAMGIYDRERGQLTEMLLANSRNPFTKEELALKNVEELRKLASFAQPAAGGVVQNAAPMNFAGAGMGANPIQNAASAGPALGLPSTRISE